MGMDHKLMALPGIHHWIPKSISTSSLPSVDRYYVITEFWPSRYQHGAAFHKQYNSVNLQSSHQTLTLSSNLVNLVKS